MPDLVRSAVLSNYVEVARSVGLDAYALVKSVGLSPACLIERDMKIPTAAVRRLLEDSAALSGVENFGLRMAKTRRLSILGQLGMLVRDAPTVRHVLGLIIEHMRLHNESLHLHLEEGGGVVTIRQSFWVDEPGDMRQTVELSLGAQMRILRFFFDSHWSPRRVCFVHQSPVDLSLHRQIFGSALAFDCEFDGIVCNSSDLDSVIVASDPVMARYARETIEAGLSAGSKSVQHEVQHLVLRLLPAGRCTVERAARHLNLDRRTLHRHLDKEGTTFTQIVNSTRIDLSERYLANPNRNLREISDLLGFSGLSAFSRWHRTQFNVTASERQVHLQR